MVFTNPGPNGTNAYQSDPRANLIEYQTFTLTNQSSFDTVDWFGDYIPDSAPLTDNFTIDVYNTSGGVASGVPIYSFSPGNAVNRTANGTVTDGLTDYAYSANLGSSTNLAAGQYAISIVNDTVAPGSIWFWCLSTAPATDGANADQDYFGGANNGSSVNSNALGTLNSNLAFSLVQSNASVTATPEPGVVVTGLSMLGMTGLGLVRGRMRRRK